jgi:hypothetical protein
MSGVAVVALAYGVASNGGTLGAAVQSFKTLALVLAVSLALGFAWSYGDGRLALPDMLQRWAIALSASATLALLLYLLRAPGDIQRNAFLRALSESPRNDLRRFLDQMSKQPLLNGLIVAEGEALSDYDQDSLREVLERRPVWTTADLRYFHDPEHPDIGEQLLDLIARNAARYLVAISFHPLRIGLVYSATAREARSDTADMLIFHRVADDLTRRIP